MHQRPNGIRDRRITRPIGQEKVQIDRMRSNGRKRQSITVHFEESTERSSNHTVEVVGAPTGCIDQSYRKGLIIVPGNHVRSDDRPVTLPTKLVPGASLACQCMRHNVSGKTVLCHDVPGE